MTVLDSSATRHQKARQNNLLSGALVVALLLAAVWMGVDEVRQAVPTEGPAPAFTMERFSGGTAALESLKGQVVMVDFWATWCGPCKAEMPWLAKLGEEYASKGVTFIAAATDDADVRKVEVALFVDRLPELKPFVAFAEPEDQARYKVRLIPSLFVIDRHGQLAASVVGSTSEASVRGWLDDALAKP